jgi:peptide/nickel transport system permease protein
LPTYRSRWLIPESGISVASGSSSRWFAPQPQRRGRGAASLNRDAWQRFKKHTLARVSLVILSALYLCAAFADFLASYPESYLDASTGFQPPNRIYLRDEAGRISWPYTYAYTRTLDLETFQNVYSEDRSRRYPLRFLVRREGLRDRYVPFPVNLIPIQLRRHMGIHPWATLRLFGIDDPTDRVKFYLWGADDIGGDVYGKILYGSRISLTIGILGSLTAIAIGLLMGGLAGFFGGWIDELIMRLVEALSAIPTIFLLLALSAIFYPLNWPSSYVFIAVILALALIGWGGVARAVRGLILSLREQEFTLAARALGASNHRIIARHLIPQTFNYIIVLASLSIPGFILFEAVLSFYGVGIQPPATSWGLMLNTAQRFTGIVGLADRWWIYLPGAFIFIAVLSWNLLGDGLRDAYDPRKRR